MDWTLARERLGAELIGAREAEGALRFGGVKALCWTPADERPSDSRAA